MKTPIKPTKARLEKAPAARIARSNRIAAIQPWGAPLGRVIVAQAIKLGANLLRKRMKARVEGDYPEGKAMARQRYFGQQRGLPGGETAGAKNMGESSSRKARRARVNIVQAIVRNESTMSFKNKADAAQPVWRELGPTLIPHGQTYGEGPGATPSVSGRCSGIMVDRSDSRHLVLCSAGGGLWGSFDAGATWTSLTDHQPTLVMGAIMQSPSAPAIVYAATGDGDGGIPYGIGLLRSSDGGATWKAVPVAALTGVGSYDLAIDPSNALRVWIATDQALYLSANGGDTARAVLKGKCWSVSIHPTQSVEVMAAFEDGLMHSIDGGANWSRLVLPGTDASTRFSRLEVCHAPGNGAVAYIAGCAGKIAMLWRRASMSGNFTALNVPTKMQTAQAWYDWCLSVAIDDEDLIFWGAIDLFRGRRTNAGMTWQNVSSRSSSDSIHPDQHFVAFDRSSPSLVYACNDGGVFCSSDRGDHWVSLNPGLGITEFEFLAELEGTPNWLMGGTQDNGSLVLAGPLHWDQIALGDGGDCMAIDRGKSSICYHSYYDMPIERAAALGPNAFDWTDVTPPIPDNYTSDNSKCLFYPPLEASGSMLVKAGSTVWISADEGRNWDEIVLPTSTDADPDLATSLAIVGDHTVIVGMWSGQLWRISRGSGAWSVASVNALTFLPNRFVSDLAVVGSVGKVIWASCSRMGGSHVFRSDDGGKTFSNKSSNLPDVPINALVVDPKDSKTVYLASDHGVYRTTNAGGNWSDFSNGLPHVIVGELILHAGSRLLRAGTRSRGAWELTL